MDPNNCGDCGACVVQGGQGTFTVGFSCEAGRCVAHCSEATGDCDDKLGCEAFLDTPDHCGRCDRKTCAAAHTLLTCDAGEATCASPLCEPGFANCDQSRPDCETPVGTATSCIPTYLSTVKHHASSVYSDVAMGPDGSVFLTGHTDEADDFDPTSGVDERSPGASRMTYITKLNADGSYAWTRWFDAEFLLVFGLAADAGGVVAVGEYGGRVDFDPGAGTAIQTASKNANGDAFVVKLTQAGEYSWAHSLFSQDDDLGGVSVSTVALSGGEVYVGGAYVGAADFDPGPGESLLSTPTSAQKAFVLKFDAEGNFGWVRGSEGVDCSDGVVAMSAAGQGPVWVTGGRRGACRFTSEPLNAASAFVAAFESNGELRGEWAMVADVRDAQSISAAADGSAFVAGTLRRLEGGDVDLDPGPGVDRHGVIAGTTGFVTKLGADGSYVWSKLMGLGVDDVAATPDGGLLASSETVEIRFVSKVRGDASAAWSLGYFSARNPFHLAASGDTLVVASVVDHGDEVDFNPFPGASDTGPAGETAFFSRYAY
jgi:hypothetical protein